MSQNESNKDKDLIEALGEIREAFIDSMTNYKNESEAFWDSLSVDEQLKAFCAVVRRIHKGEIEERGSYRYVLYDVFGFESDAYMVAQDAGYLEIHNAIFDGENVGKLIKEFCEKHMDITNDNLQEQINNFIFKKHF